MRRAVLEAEAVVSGFEDVAVMGEPIEQRGGHLGVAEDARPFAEAEIGGDDHAGMLVEPAEQLEEQGTARSTERQVAELIKDDEIGVRQAADLLHSSSPLNTLICNGLSGLALKH